MPDPTRQCELCVEISLFASLFGELSCDSKLKITKDLVTQTQDHTAPLNSRLKITQQLLTQPNSSESRDALDPGFGRVGHDQSARSILFIACLLAHS